MTDDDLDRALAAAVSVEHSADFVARVRGRVAQEHRPRWFFPWRVALAGAAVTAVFVIASVSWPDGQRDVRTPASIAVSKEPAGTVSAAPPVISAPPTEGAPTSVRVRHRPSINRRPPAAPPFTEPLIAQEDARAIRLLVASATEGRVLRQLQVDGVSTRDAVTLPRIEVPRVIVEPLAEIARLEGDRP